MICALPPPLSDEQISAALDGTADRPTRAHLKQCSYCRERLAQAQHFDQGLRTHLAGWRCPPAQQLGEYLLELVELPLRQALAAHITVCPRCTHELAELRSFLVGDAAPARQPAPARRPLAPRLGELLASFVPRAPALALRGVAPHQLTAEANGTTIMLDIQPAAGGTAMLRGQLLDDDQDRWNGALVEARQAGALQLVTMVDDLGTFSLGPLPAAPTELRLVPPHGQAVRVPTFALAQP